LGKLSIIAGDPGLGKSYLTLDVSARISLGGPWPDGGNAPQGNVLIISAEDGLEDTIRPRLDLLDADLSRIHAVSTTLRQGNQEVPFSLIDHLVQLEQAIIQHNAVLLVLDPVLAFTGKRTDTYKSSEVRAVLAPLATMADRTGCAVLAVLHLNKRSGELNSIYRLTASLDFAAAARSVLVVGKHPDDSNCRVLAPVKMNCRQCPHLWPSGSPRMGPSAGAAW
jgi:putative DNA primase/helicase